MKCLPPGLPEPILPKETVERKAREQRPKDGGPKEDTSQQLAHDSGHSHSVHAVPECEPYGQHRRNLQEKCYEFRVGHFFKRASILRRTSIDSFRIRSGPGLKSKTSSEIQCR